MHPRQVSCLHPQNVIAKEELRSPTVEITQNPITVIRTKTINLKKERKHRNPIPQIS
jgi:hypothetical protein